jgi:hypothetical protein
MKGRLIFITNFFVSGRSPGRQTPKKPPRSQSDDKNKDASDLELSGEFKSSGQSRDSQNFLSQNLKTSKWIWDGRIWQ